MAEKDLEYYMANPGEMPTDVASLEKLMAGEQIPQAEEDSGAAAAEEEDANTNTEAEAPAAEAKSEDEAPPAEEPKAEEAPIESKDGKHTIPYAVLATERERRQAAERAVQQMNERLLQLEAQADGGKEAPTTQVPEISTEDMKALEEDFPGVAKILNAMAQRVQMYEGHLAQLGQIEAQRVAAERQNESRTVQEVIDGIPVLRYWQAENPDLFAAAVQVDNAIKVDPRFSALSLQDRFERVINAVEAIHGKTELPPEYQPPKPPEPKVDADLVKKATEQIEKAGSFKPKTLSDMPGGEPPKASNLDEIGSMSVDQIGAMMQKMDTTDINALLAKLG